MPKPPLSIYLLMLCLPVGLLGCTSTTWKEGRTFPFISPLPPGTSITVAVEPPRSTPPELLPPAFEDAAVVPAWARPVAPENSFNTQISPDSRYLVYLANHPGTRFTSLYSVPLAGGMHVRLNTAVSEESIFYPAITSDSRRVVYYPGYDSSGLYSVTITGTEHMTLTTDTIWGAMLSPDGEWVVYTGESEAGTEALSSVPAIGGKPVRLADAPSSSSGFQITPNSQTVVFSRIDWTQPRVQADLYTVPIQGGKQIHLNHGVETETGSPFFITPDGQTVIFGNLYAVPIQGGSPRQLNTLAGIGRPEYDHIDSTQLSPDGRWLLYRSGTVQGNWRSLFSVPLAGGPPIQLNKVLADGASVQGFFISPDGQSVIYQQGLREQEPLESYIVALSGGTGAPFPAWYSIHVSPDGRWYVYTTREASGTDVYSIPVDGGTAIKLNSSVPVNSTVAYVQISPDSRTVLYATSKDAGSGMPVFDGFYRVPIEGGKAIETTGVDGRDRLFGSFTLPNSQILFANADYDGDGRYALYAYLPAPLPAPAESQVDP